MNPNPPLRIPRETDALENLRDAYYQLQHHEVALDELWEATEGGKRLGHEAFIDRQLKEVADQADRLRETLQVVRSIRRYRRCHVMDREAR